MSFTNNPFNQIGKRMERGNFLLWALAQLGELPKGNAPANKDQVKKILGLIINERNDQQTAEQGLQLAEALNIVGAVIPAVQSEWDSWYKNFMKQTAKALQNVKSKPPTGGEMHESLHKTYKLSAQRVAYRYLSAGKKDYVIYHDTYTSAVREAMNLAEKNGYTLDEEEVFREVTTGVGRPKEGGTSSHKLQLFKNGKPVRKMLVFQVYGMSRSYELTAYIS